MEAGPAIAEVEAGQPRNRFPLAAGDGVEVVLHAGCEGEVDELRKMLFEQGDGGKRSE